VKISLGTWAFSFGPFAGHPVPLEDIVKRASQAGYDGLDLGGFPPYLSLDQYPTSQARREVVRYLADHGLGVSGYAPDLTAVNPVTPGNESRYLESFERNLEMAADLSSPTIRVDTVAAPGSLSDEEYTDAFRRLADLWGQAAGIAQKAGVMLVWEFEPGFVVNKPSEVVGLHDRVNHPNFKIMFDTSHAYMCSVVGARQQGRKETLRGGVAEFLSLLRGRIGAVHLIDSDGTLHADETSTHRPFGEGYINFRELTPKLLEVPGIEWWCIDLSFWAGSWTLVESSLRFVKDLLRSSTAVLVK
jgi:sugar phosphate isomerase/epimerase